MHNPIATLLLAIFLSFTGYYVNATPVESVVEVNHSRPVDLVEFVTNEVIDFKDKAVQAFSSILSQMKTLPQAIVDTAKAMSSSNVTYEFDSIEEVLLAFTEAS